MGSIQISKDFSMPREELKTELDELAGKLEQKFDLDCHWRTEDRLDFTRAGIDGHIDISGQCLDMTVNLGFLLGAFAKNIEDSIREFLDTHIY